MGRRERRHGSAAAAGVGPDSDVELLGMGRSVPADSSPETRPGAGAVAGPDRRRGWLFAIAGVVMAIALYWLATGGADREAVVEPDSEAAGVEPDNEAAGVEPDRARADGGSIPAGPGPLLGEEVGLRLVVGSFDERPAFVLDLDSGERSELGRTGAVLGANSSWIVFDDVADGLVALPAGDPTGAAVPIALRDAPWPGAFGRWWSTPDPDVWITMDDGAEVPQLKVVDLARGTVEERSSSPLSFGSGPRGVVSSLDGRIFAIESDGTSRLLLSGYRLVSASRSYLLVSRCDGVGRCPMEWRLRSDGSPIDRGPVPPSVDQPFYVNIQPLGSSDRAWIIPGSISSTGWMAPQLWDAESGEVVDLPPARVQWFSFPYAVSDDDRFVAAVAGDRVEIRDLDTGVVTPVVEVVARGEPGSVSIALVSDAPAEGEG